MKACTATPVHPGELCVNDSGPMAFTRGRQGVECARCCRAMDTINAERARAGLAAEEPDWASFQRSPKR